VPESTGGEHSIPISICCNEDAGMFAQVVFRYPFDELNTLLLAELAEDWRDKDEYFLGTYTRNQRIWFNSLKVKSAMQSDAEGGAPLVFDIHASGRLRYMVEDCVFGARITAKVKQLDGEVRLTPELHKHGVGFKFDGVINHLKISVNNMAPWLEHKLERDLRHSLEHSLNKRKRVRKFARMRLPYWVPLDTVFDVELTNKD
jgi:hypothetical protein